MSRADFFKLKAFEYDIDKILKKRHIEPGGEVQKYIDTECLRRCEELVPKRDNILIQSGIINTQIGSGEVKYRTPYARRWYYMPANFNEGSGSGTGAVGRENYWFYRMARDNREQILKGAQKVANGG